MELRYLPDDFDEYLVLEAAPTAVAATVKHILVDKTADLPLSKFEALCANSEMFRQTWEMKRRMKDVSPSAWDMSLATQAAGVGWTDQEIANLMIAFRNKHGFDLKRHQSYFQLTIGKARASAAAQGGIDRLAEMEVSLGPQIGDEDRAAVLKEISLMLGVELIRWRQTGRESAIYAATVKTDSGEFSVKIGSAAKVMDQASFRASIYEATGVVLERRKGAEWDTMARLLARIVEIEDAEELERRQEMREWLRLYLFSQNIVRGDGWQDALAQGGPFVTEGRLSLSLPDITRFIFGAMNLRIQKSDLIERLRLVGFTPETVTARLSTGVRINRYRWEINESVFDLSETEAKILDIEEPKKGE
jgi:hypothetical protein